MTERGCMVTERTKRQEESERMGEERTGERGDIYMTEVEIIF